MADVVAKQKADNINLEVGMQDESRHSVSHSSTKNSYRQKYKRTWELDTNLRDWLSACHSDAHAAFCKYCRTKLHAHKKGLLAHAKSAKHKKHMMNPNFPPDALTLMSSDTYNNVVADLQTNGDSGYINNANDLDDSESKCSKRNYKGQRLFNENWLEDPSFSSWLRKVPNNNAKALCIACRCVITAGRCELMKHTRAAKHKKAMGKGPFEEVGESDLHWLEANPNQEQNLLSAPYNSQQQQQQLFSEQPLVMDVPGMLLDDILKKLNEHVPIELAEKWDNVGIITKPIQLITRPIKISNVLLTIDLDEWVVDEAIRKQAQLIISYHPPIFSPMKCLNPDQWKDRAILMCNKHDITIHSPHTALDAINEGINDWLISPFIISGSGSVVEPVIPKDCPIQLQRTPETTQGKIGMGRIVKLAVPVPLNEVVQRIKTHLDLAHIRLAMSRKHTRESRVESIAVCAGSGSSILKGCRADVWITGEMSHHEVLDAIHCGTTVILCEHSNTERGFLRNWSRHLKSAVFNDNILVTVSELDKDPLNIV